MNDTIHRFNESILLDGEGETFEQYRAVSNAVTAAEREIASEEKRLRESGLFSDAGVVEKMRTMVTEKLNLFDSYENDVLTPREAATKAKLTDANRYMTVDDGEKERILHKFNNGGPAIRREMLTSAFSDPKLATVLSTEEQYLTGLTDHTRNQLRETANIGDPDQRMQVERQVDAVAAVREKMTRVRDDFERRLI
jgi:hypothetical protein